MKVFIVEDAAAMFGNLRAILSGIPGVAVIGHAADDAIERIGALLPDLVALDISLGNGAGIGMLENIKKRHPGIKVMVLADSADEFYFNRCKSAGADYYFDKVFQLTQALAVLWQWADADRSDDEARVLPSPVMKDAPVEHAAGFPWRPACEVA